jgi:sugar lactone lactonase YvrE
MAQILQSNRRQSHLLLAFIVLLAAVSPALAIADSKPEVEGPTSSSSEPLTPGLIQQALEDPGVMGATPLTDSSAAEQLPRDDLGRDEALELVESVFGAAVEDPAGIWDELSEARILGGHTAVLPGGVTQTAGAEEEAETQSVLVESSVPLLSEIGSGVEEPVDLSLETNEGALQPANPLVSTELPAKLGEGVSLADDSMHLAFADAAPSRAPSILDESLAFYPNTAQDADVMIAPTPRGVETFMQLRTPEAPRNQEIELELPEGTVLRGTDQGGAEAERNGRTLLKIPPPTAIDASGAQVPMTLSVSGNSVVLEISPPADVTYPILADPQWLVESYAWTWGGSNFAGWLPSQTAGGYRVLEYAYPNQSVRALGLSSGWEGGASPNTGAQWYYPVPRMYSDWGKYGEYPSTWLENVHLEGVEYRLEGSSGSDPVMVAGILDPYQNLWISVGSHAGNEGEITGHSGNYEYSSAGNHHGKLFSFGLITRENESYVKYRTATAANATAKIGDNDTPEILSVDGPEGWRNTGEPTVSYAATDKGLGIYSLQVTPPGQSASTYSVGCSGGGANPCPREEKSADTSNVKVPVKLASAPEGADTFTLGAADPLYAGPGSNAPEPVPHLGTATFRVNVDHSAPTLALTGSVTEQAALGTTKPQYSVKFSATDGTEEAPTLAVLGATGIFSHPADIALDSTGNRWVADYANNRIVKYDPSGVILATYSAVGSTESLSHPTGIDVDSSGNVWVVDTGHSRLVEFTPKGEWWRKIGNAGSGNGEFNNPTGIAVGSNGNLWVADTGNNRVQEFSSTGSFIGAFGGKGSANGQFLEPSSVDVGPGNNVWVSDTGNNRIEELDEKGEFVATYGALGSGNGQLNHPTGIEVDTRGSVWVVDQNNGRVEQFSERGEYLGKFGTAGAGETQFTFSAPAGIATTSIGGIMVTDSGNNRISRWNAPQGTRSGLRKTVVRVDGKVVQEPSVTCPQGGCPLSGEWTLHSGEYAAGVHTVEVTATDGVGLTKTEKVVVTLNPPAPSVTLSGTLTQQSTLGKTLPRYGLKVESFAEEGTGAAPALPTFLSAITPTSETAKLSHPAGVVRDGSGNVWVVDKGDNRIVEYKESGEFIRAAGSLGSGAGQLNSPSAIAIDTWGNLDVADTANNRVVRFTSEGKFQAAIGVNVNKTKVEAGGTTAERNYCTAASGNVCQAGSTGSAEGLMAEPVGIASSAGGGGSVYVVERAANRVEKYGLQGELLAKFGSAGSGSGQLSEPSAIAIGPKHLWVADTGNNRIEKWSFSWTYEGQFGSVGSGNGELRRPSALSDDSFGNVWVVDQGNNRVEKFSEAGTYLGKFGKTGTGAGQFTLSSPTGIVTDPMGSIWISDTNNNRIERWRQGARSQLNTEITIDGNRVDSGEARCLVETCPTTREWTLESSTLAPGTHILLAKATDGYGQWTTKSRTIEIQRDTTKPVLQVAGELANAPEGWVQQESYNFTAASTDPSGYGVTSLIFKIDGNQVASTTQGCPNGGCEAGISKAINMAAYSGGAHAAEVVASDGAGNTSTERWTINVDPEGRISTAEATATLEAVEETAASTPLGGGVDSAGVEGGAPLGLEVSGTGFTAIGGSVPTAVSSSPGGSMTLEIPTASENTDEALLPVIITPVGTAEGASPSSLFEENVAVSSNTQASVDTTVRPLDDGGMVYAAIRNQSAPEKYSYRVTLGAEQELRRIDEKHVQAFYNTGQPSFLISAEPATDAVGTEVLTTLELTGSNTVTLVVHHRAGHLGLPFVYPVVAGSGWEGGFHTSTVDMDNVPPESTGPTYWETSSLIVSAPEIVTDESGGASASGVVGKRKKYLHVRCGHAQAVERPSPYDINCGNPFIAELGTEVIWNMAIRGAFFYEPGVFAYQKGAIRCEGYGYDTDLTWEWIVQKAYQCEYGPRTSDGNGGREVAAGHYLRSQAHWLLGHRSRCTYGSCPDPDNNPWLWEDRALELHLWPSGIAEQTVG